MTPEAQRIAIAQACGWNWVEEIHDTWCNAFWQRGKDKIIPRGEDLTTRRRNGPDFLPDYLNDLNTMHEAEKVLVRRSSTDNQPLEYHDILNRICQRDTRDTWSATAAQRAEAFLKTLGLWTP